MLALYVYYTKGNRTIRTMPENTIVKLEVKYTTGLIKLTLHICSFHSFDLRNGKNMSVK